MGYISKEYLTTQFQNFADRISNVFAKKAEISNINNTADATKFVKGLKDQRPTEQGVTKQNVVFSSANMAKSDFTNGGSILVHQYGTSSTPGTMKIMAASVLKDILSVPAQDTGNIDFSKYFV